MKRSPTDWALRLLTGGATLAIVSLLAIVVGLVLIEGIPHLSGEFLTETPSADMTGGGIVSPLLGTAVLTMLMTVAVVPVGVATGIYLAEYAPKGSRLADWVRAAVANLAGVPSIVFGLFGLGFFILFVGGGLDAIFHDGATPVWGQPCLLWASLTLAVLTLPVVIVTTEEAFRSVPDELREAALGLGATRLQMVGRVVLPKAAPGVLTGVILAIGRGAGEVAPIIFTGAANYLPEISAHPREMFMHLGYHVYVLSTQSPNVDAARPALFGTVLVLMVVSFGASAIAMVLRHRMGARP